MAQLRGALKAMNKHSADEDVAINGCMLLNNVALTPGLDPNIAKLLLAKAPAVILSVKRACCGSSQVSQMASMTATALQALSSGRKVEHCKRRQNVAPEPLSSGQNDDRTSSRMDYLTESIRSRLGRHLFSVEAVTEL